MTASDALHQLDLAVSDFGASTKKKLSSPATTGEPEEQLRTPLEALLGTLAAICGLNEDKFVTIGETSLVELKSRPDFAVTHEDLLIGFVEVKAPGKGANPRKFRDAHDKAQWQRLKALPNLVYTDGNAFSLWRDGELESLVHLDGDVESSGAALNAPPTLLSLFESFFSWEPIPPRTPRQLAEVTARLCRLLRDEVSEQLELHAGALTELANDWRHLLFPAATDAQFADGYAQSITFGLLVARARGIEFKDVDDVGKKLDTQHSLVGTALRVLSESTINEGALKTSVSTLTRVLGVVDWKKVSKGDANAWLYFYQDFLAEYDNSLRKQTGSYYTPPEVVGAMTRLVDESLKSCFDLPKGLAEQNVTILDPGVGTGTFVLAALERIAATVDADQGRGARPAALTEALKRIIGFELQLGPYAVAQLRVLAGLVDLGVTDPPGDALRMYVTNTLDNPYVEEEHLGQIYEPIARSRREANKVKKEVPVMVIIGNPPYKERSKGAGGWIESGNPDALQKAPLDDFRPPKSWGIGAHLKHLYNPYVYFWRFATWKVFDQDPEKGHGIVAYITASGFLGGPGFQMMRQYLRQRADAIWVIDCSPEGHQPPVDTRIFQGVQQPVCITIVVRDGSTGPDQSAAIHYRQLAAGDREAKFAELRMISLEDDSWEACSDDWRAPFIPASGTAWLSHPTLEDLLGYSGSGTMPGRTWVVAPDSQTLKSRWDTLISAPGPEKPALMQEHPQDRNVLTVLTDGLPGYPVVGKSIAEEKGSCPEPVRIGYRAFDRQWIIPDKRLINRPNPTLWSARSNEQIYLVAPTKCSPSSGPGVTFTALVPDLHFHHDYVSNSSTRIYPLWLDDIDQGSNIAPGLLAYLGAIYGSAVTASDFLAYIAGVAGFPAYTKRYGEELQVPGIRVPLTAEWSVFSEATELGRRAIWLNTYGQRCVDQTADRPRTPPRLTVNRPLVSGKRPIPSSPEDMPDTLSYDAEVHLLHVGDGVVENVTPAMWNSEVGGESVLVRWFGYRRKNREKPSSGNRRVSPLGSIYSDSWLPSYTEELVDLLNVLGLFAELEPMAEVVLDKLAEAPQMTVVDLEKQGLLPMPVTARKAAKIADHPSLGI